METPLPEGSQMTEQSCSGRGRTQYSHLQVASEEIALCSTPGFCTSEFTLPTKPHAESIQLLPTQTQIIASLTKKKIIMTFTFIYTCGPADRNKGQEQASIPFCNSHFCLGFFADAVVSGRHTCPLSYQCGEHQLLSKQRLLTPSGCLPY